MGKVAFLCGRPIDMPASWGSPESWTPSDHSPSRSSSVTSSSSEDFTSEEEEYRFDGRAFSQGRRHRTSQRPPPHAVGSRGSSTLDETVNSWASSEPRLARGSIHETNHPHTGSPSESVVYDMLLAAEAAKAVDAARRRELRQEAIMVASSNMLSPRERDMIVYRLRNSLHHNMSSPASRKTRSSSDDDALSLPSASSGGSSQVAAISTPSGPLDRYVIGHDGSVGKQLGPPKYRDPRGPAANPPEVQVVQYSQPFSTFGNTVIRVGDNGAARQDPSRRQKVIETGNPSRAGHGQQRSTSPIVVEFGEPRTADESTAKSTQTSTAATAAVEVVTNRLYQPSSTLNAALHQGRPTEFYLVDSLSLNPPLANVATQSVSTSADTGRDEATTTEGIIEVVTTTVAEVGCQHDPSLGARTASTATSIVTTRSQGIDTDEPRHVSIGVNVSAPRVTAQGTSTISTHGENRLLDDDGSSSVAAGAHRLGPRDISPTPERTAPVPTPQEGTGHRSGSTSSRAYAFMSPMPFKGLRGFNLSQPRKDFRGHITPMGRKTPPRERHHVNSPPSNRLSPSVGTTTIQRAPDEAHDRRIALKCVKHAVFGEFSRSLNFREKIGMTLKEARESYDAMCEGDCDWGHTGVYRESSTHPRGTFNPRADTLVQNSISEVVRGGGCMDWSAWFAGISRRRVEEALERFSDVFVQQPPPTTYIVDSSSGGLLMRVPASRVDAVASVLY